MEVAPLIAWQQSDEYITPRLLLVRTPPSSSHAEAVPSLELVIPLSKCTLVKHLTQFTLRAFCCQVRYAYYLTTHAVVKGLIVYF